VHAHYLYDAGGQRVKKLVRKQGGLVEVTHYVGGFEHHRWGPPSNPAANNHIHVGDDQQRIAIVRLGPAHPDDRNPAVQYHLGDHLTSNNVVVDDTGTQTRREEYTPYGETSFGSYARKRYRFTGNERDEESGLAHHGARYLHPALGRWLSCDPIGPKQSANLYCYCRCSPMGSTDPGGCESKPSAADATRAVDSNRNGQVSFGEVVDYWNNTRPDAAKNNLLAIPETSFAPDALRLMYTLTAPEPPPEQTEFGRNESYRMARHGMAPGEGRTEAEQDAIADDELHPSRRAARNVKAGVELAAGLLAPEAMAAVAILTSDKPVETAGQIAVGGALFGIFGKIFTSGKFFGSPRRASAGTGVHFLDVPSARFRDPTPDEVVAWNATAADGLERSRLYHFDGTTSTHVGTAYDVYYPTGQSVAGGFHTHPPGDYPVPSGRDILTFIGPANFGGARHSVVGERFALAQGLLRGWGMEDFPLLRPIVWDATTAAIRAAMNAPVVNTRPIRHD
jgi:RHS repeat-associated protein